MKETSIKAGIIGGLCGIFAFFGLFATTSKASINESAATNGATECSMNLLTN